MKIFLIFIVVGILRTNFFAVFFGCFTGGGRRHLETGKYIGRDRLGATSLFLESLLLIVSIEQ